MPPRPPSGHLVVTHPPWLPASLRLCAGAERIVSQSMDVLVTKAVKFLSTSIAKSQHTEFFKVRRSVSERPSEREGAPPQRGRALRPTDAPRSQRLSHPQFRHHCSAVCCCTADQRRPQATVRVGGGAQHHAARGWCVRIAGMLSVPCPPARRLLPVALASSPAIERVRACADVITFEENPADFVQQDIEGGDNDTRRRVASDLVRAMGRHFAEEVRVLHRPPSSARELIVRRIHCNSLGTPCGLALCR